METACVWSLEIISCVFITGIKGSNVKMSEKHIGLREDGILHRVRPKNIKARHGQSCKGMGSFETLLIHGVAISEC